MPGNLTFATQSVSQSVSHSVTHSLTYLLTHFKDYHTKSIDNHHLLPIKIHIATNTYTGSLAVTHSNQFIKFYYYGGGYAGALIALSNAYVYSLTHSFRYRDSRLLPYSLFE